MFIRTSSRRNKDGTKVSYLQLAHNTWDPVAKTSKMKVLYNFGRLEQVDRAGIERLIASLSKLVDSPVLTADGEGAAGEGLSFIESRPLGGAWVLDALWARLGIDKTMGNLLGKTRRDAAVERVLFALVANRALAPSSKLAAVGWVNNDVHIPGLGQVSDDACYRAMDWLIEVEAQLAKKVYASTADLLNLEVDLLFFDTTSTYFETETADEPVWRDTSGRPVPPATPEPDEGEQEEGERAGQAPAGAVKQTGFRTYGKSKDSRDQDS